MADESVERRLAAILAADVAGYSRLTGIDEEGTMRRLRALHAEIIEPLIQTHRGRIIKTMGDGVLAEFASVVDAVRTSVKVQRDVAVRNIDFMPENHIELRIGIHLGDVMVQPDGDLLGDTVNIAARLESIAERGGICLSEDAYRQVRDRMKVGFVDLGEQRLKNIARPMRVYTVKNATRRPASAKKNAAAKNPSSPRRGSERTARAAPLQFATPVRVRSPGHRATISTVEEAIKLIDRNVPQELASLPRWTFARALLAEALKTGKSRDINAAGRQLTQALSNERWLDND